MFYNGVERVTTPIFEDSHKIHSIDWSPQKISLRSTNQSLQIKQIVYLPECKEPTTD